jgi:hypothetical protein
MDRLETCCLCEVAEWWNDRELTIWHVNDEHLPVHLECWINGYFAVTRRGPLTGAFPIE